MTRPRVAVGHTQDVGMAISGKSTIYFSASTDAVDAFLLTKDKPVLDFVTRHGIGLSNSAAIGDSVSDLPFLTIPNLGLVGTLGNAQSGVKQAVRNLKNGWISSFQVQEGFLEFYELAGKEGISHIFSDKDGVLAWKGDSANRHRLRRVFQAMGLGVNPLIIVLTGSSYEQNLDFMREHGIDSSLSANPHIRRNPYLILAENGAVQINVLTRQTRESMELLDTELLSLLKGNFERELIATADRRILPGFELGWSNRSSDQVEKIYVPPKKTMITLNMPRQFRDGREYGRSTKAQELQNAILESMVDLAVAVGLPYEVI